MNIKQILYAITIIANVTTISSYAVSPHYKHLQETAGINPDISKKCEQNPKYIFGLMSHKAMACDFLDKYLEPVPTINSTDTYNDPDITIDTKHPEEAIERLWGMNDERYKGVGTYQAVATILDDQPRKIIAQEANSIWCKSPILKRISEIRQHQKEQSQNR